ncbi:MAG: 4-hydroxy-3-methylbut-2-enyl diphosphate reductase [Deltaproteobacteria bacterium]|nr:4-hydroxy-3-methylbut-2-enyl diphosphate reductase [Deltaproteobacteria bacterium]MBN2846404.1 4-hydroxy-3-methylbut-2-enyl diphosphate reductase [Deltaproteobacteria bacterium]
MGIKLAKTAGFCMGVKRAVDIVLDIAQSKGDEKVYTYGPLIHNPQTVELLKGRGIVPIFDIDEVDEGTIVVRAHGISPQEREKINKKGLKIFDATCPRVARVQSIIKKHASLGYTIIIAGDREHPEVAGLLGYSYGNGVAVGTKDEVDELPLFDKVCVVAQTTQNTDQYEKIVEKIREKYSQVVVFNTICDSTEKRQEEISDLSREMDGIIIVGGKNSANTKRLAMTARQFGTPTFHVETADELREIDLNGYEKIGVSAGASTPNWITDGVIDHLTHYQDEQDHKKLKFLYSLWIFLVRTDIYTAIGAGFLSFASMLLQGLRPSAFNILIAATYVYAMHIINRVQFSNSARVAGSFRGKSYDRHKKTYLAIAVLCLVVSIMLSSFTGAAPFVLLLSISCLGLLYNINIFPSGWGPGKLGDLPGSKEIFTATAWAAVIAVLPQIGIGLTITPDMAVTFLVVFTIVFSKTALSDMMDIQSDRLVGRETIPVIIGEEGTGRLLRIISLLTGAILLALTLAGYSSFMNLALLASLFYIWICLELCVRKARFYSIVLEGLLETNYIIAGLCVSLWYCISAYVL